MGKQQYKSAALAAVHETALGLAEAGVLDKQTMKTFDAMCLTPIEELTPEQIRQIRLREKASQAVFARYLNVTSGLVSQWERGEKRPRGASLKLLTLVAKNGLGAVA
jgi:putative transcriptional regulator